MESFKETEKFKSRLKRVQELYELGKKYKDSSYEELIYGNILPEWMMMTSNPLWDAAFEAGRNGKDIPTYTQGWRYGDIPEGGRSKDHREDKLEQGVSMMEVEDANGGDKLSTGDMVSSLFLRDRPKRKLMGWLNTNKRGADDEPLLLDPEYHPEDEILLKQKKKLEKKRLVGH